jgi:ABC-type glutathione transport system ATPase component
MKQAAIRLDNVCVRYARGMPWQRSYIDAARGVSFEIAEGTTLGLVGESGSGKTTIGKICLGLLKPTAGSAYLGGEAIYGIGRRKPGTLAAVLQHPEWSLNPKLTIGRSIAEPLRVTGVTRSEVDAKVALILDRVGLSADFAGRLPNELSGGQRQRVSIARALVTTPRFVVFDEAVSALDVSIQAQILNLMKELQRDIRFAALFISHDLAAVRYLAHDIAVMNEGAIVEHASSEKFYAPMANTYVRRLQEASGLIPTIAAETGAAP